LRLPAAVLQVAILVAFLAVGLPHPAPAFQGEPISSQSSAEFPPPDRRAKHPKLDSHLVAVASAADTAGVAAGIQVARERRLAISANRVRVVLRTSGDRSPVRKVVVALGGVVDAEYADLVQAFVPTTVLRRLADDP